MSWLIANLTLLNSFEFILPKKFKPQSQQMHNFSGNVSRLHEDTFEQAILKNPHQSWLEVTELWSKLKAVDGLTIYCRSHRTFCQLEIFNHFIFISVQLNLTKWLQFSWYEWSTVKFTMILKTADMTVS